MYDRLFWEIENIYSISLNDSDKKKLSIEVQNNLNIFTNKQPFPINIGIKVLLKINESNILRPISKYFPFTNQATRLKQTLFFLTIFGNKDFLRKISEDSIDIRVVKYLNSK